MSNPALAYAVAELNGAPDGYKHTPLTRQALGILKRLEAIADLRGLVEALRDVADAAATAPTLVKRAAVAFKRVLTANPVFRGMSPEKALSGGPATLSVAGRQATGARRPKGQSIFPKVRLEL